MRLVLDAMGGDYAPREIVRGVIAARDRETADEFILVGDGPAIEAELAKAGAPADRIRVRHATEVVSMAEPPVEAVRRKPDSSMRRAVELMAAGEADAVISAGNTGAFVAAAHMVARRLPGIRRPGISVVLPSAYGPCVLIDVGANVDCRPTHLVQYALMASLYARKVIGVAEPRVGLLSIGEESEKGNELALQTRRELEASPVNFRGNAEGRDLFNGRFDVVVCDGFVGNIVLKSVEALAASMFQTIREETRSLDPRIAAPLAPVLEDLRRRHDSNEYGGAPLLGIDGIVIICHGNSNARAVASACQVASRYARAHVNRDIVEAVAHVGETAT